MKIDDYGPILKFVLEQGSPCRLPPPWQFLKSRDCLNHIPHTKALIRSVYRKFFAEDVDALIIDAASAGDERLCAELSEAPGPLVALRNGSGVPFLVITPRGCVPREIDPIAAACNGWSEDFGQEPVLFGAFRLRDLAILRALGLQATSCADWRHTRWRALARRLASLDYRSEQTALPRRPLLALVGWDLAGLAVPASPPPRLRRLANHLTLLRHDLDVLMPGVQVWRPEPREVQALQTAVNSRCPRLIRALLLLSAQVLHDFEQFADVRGPEAASEPTVASALAKLREMADLSRQYPVMKEAAQEANRAYLDAVDRELIDPLRRWAAEQRGPRLQNAAAHTADVFALLHRIGPNVNELVDAALAQGALGTEVQGLLQQFLAASKQATLLSRELRS
jgi:hypothetical protein